jgi:hypothetical protein
MTTYRRYKTNILFHRPSFIDGIGSIFNLAGNYFEFNYSKSGEEADRKAIESDWGMVGYDIRKVAKKPKKELLEMHENGR